jgi:dienelactone hydrolase
MRWGAIPWPDDLYLEGGHVSVTALPFESAELREPLEDALATIDGAGVRPTLVFVFDGEIDGDSLPASPAASLTPESSVFLIDADASSPNAFERIPLEVELSSDRRSIRALVAFDRPLTPGRRYAAVVTDSVRTLSGRQRVRRSRELESILDSDVPTSDVRDKLARAQYLPILPALEDDGIARSRVVALSSFRVQSAERDLDEARASFDDGDVSAAPRFEAVLEGEALDDALGVAPEGVSGAKPGKGVAHQHIAALAHLTIRTPAFSGVSPGGRTAFTRNEKDGQLDRLGEHEVPCSLIVPRTIGSLALPIVLFQHGIFGERSDALPVANELAATGYAVLTCDAPVHGSRLPGSDTGNRFSGASEPDGFGDMIGDVLGRGPGAGQLADTHPFYYRDAVQQAVVDWMAIVATLRSGAWDEPLSNALEDVTVARDNIGFIGVDVGAEIGVALVGREPVIRAAVLAFAGGRAIDDWNAGPDYEAFREAYADLLEGPDEQGFEASFRGDVSVLRMLLDSGTGLAHAGPLRRSDTNLLAYIGENDELVPLASSEALAYALGEVLLDAVPQYELALRRVLQRPSAGTSGNFALSRGAVTRVAQSLSQATRATLFSQEDFAHYEQPLELPPVLLDDSRPVINPTAAVMRQLVFFFESYRACLSTQTEPLLPCAASVAALRDER